MKDPIDLMKKEMLRRAYSPRTIDTYCFCIEKFFRKCNKHPRKITKKDIREYLDFLVEKKKSGSMINLSLCSIKFLLEQVFNRNIYIKLKFSKRAKTLPTYMTKKETKRFFAALENKKHKLMLQLMYSAGLRLSELLKLKIKDFEFEENYAWVRKGKGNKDRQFMIAKKIKRRLISHIKENTLNHDDFLFKGKNGHLSPRTIQEIVKRASKKAKLIKNVHPHTIRHSFATHLAENNCSITTLQALLGHSSIQTTNIYIHMKHAKMFDVKSPFDSL